MCEIFNVSRSGYYSWISREPSKRNIINQKLDQNIKLIFEANKSRYGAPRITKALKAQNEKYSLNKVARKMNKMNLQAIAKKKFKVTADSEHTKPIYENVLNSDFVAAKINQNLVGDIYYIKTE
ncbi:MAG: IS3 family transposase [Gammaproteobacteria bacterium]